MESSGTPTADNVATSGAMTANSVSLNGTLQSAYTPSGSPSIYPKRMSINTDLGFSIVQWNTGSNPNAMTTPHGLGKQPKVIWQKGGYTSDAYNWDTLFQWLPTGGGNYNGHLGRTILNSSNGFTNNTGNTPWGDVRPTADVWTSDNSSSSNYDYYGQNKNMISYVWTDIPDFFSDFGFYRNGETIGRLVYTGFKPAFVLIKNVSNGSTHWSIWDEASEDDYNKLKRTMFRNLVKECGGTNTTARIDFLSNGFRSVGGQGSFVNALNDAYIYMGLLHCLQNILPRHTILRVNKIKLCYAEC